MSDEPKDYDPTQGGATVDEPCRRCGEDKPDPVSIGVAVLLLALAFAAVVTSLATAYQMIFR